MEKQLNSVKSFKWELLTSLFKLIGLIYGFIISDNVPKKIGVVLLCISFCWQKNFEYQAANILKNRLTYNKVY